MLIDTNLLFFPIVYGSFENVLDLNSGQMSRLKKNTYVSTHTLETLCRILDCRIEDVMEVSFEDEKKENEAN